MKDKPTSKPKFSREALRLARSPACVRSKNNENAAGPAAAPWDRRQTHSTLVKYLTRRPGEVGRAVRKDWENLKEELGDVLRRWCSTAPWPGATGASAWAT